MSNNPPWMPLNVGDYLRDTGHLTVVEHGAYMLLIMRYWQDGGLPSSERLIQRYSHLTAEQWEESCEVLSALFDEGWKHKRIDAELAKANEIIGKRKAAGQQRSSKSSAHAQQTDSTSSYTRVPPKPLPEPEEDKSPAPIPVAQEGARDFDEILEIFPRNPSSNDLKAANAFDALTKADQAMLLPAAKRYRAWFTEDCITRKRTEDAGAKYVPHLSTWIEDGGWRNADALPLKSEKVAPVVPMKRLSRSKEPELWAACERVIGKPAPTSDDSWPFPIAIVDRAAAELIGKVA